jgi:hypothetical protein
VLDYKSEVARLRSELFGMQAALTQIEQDLTLASKSGTLASKSPNLGSTQFQRTLRETHAILAQLANTLDDGITKFHRNAKRLVWPLKKNQVQALATHLERLKSFFVLAAIQDTLQITRNIEDSLRDLWRSVEDVRQASQDLSDYKEATSWLAPANAEVAHNTALSARLADTNSWFLDGTFNEWISGTNPLLWLIGKPGTGKTCLTAACVEKYAISCSRYWSCTFR